MLIYGPPKVGKSLLTGTLAEEYELIWFDLENGHDVLYQLPIEWQKNVELVKLPDTRSFPIAIETCKKIIKASMPIDICELHGKVACALCKKAGAAEYRFDPAALTDKSVLVFDSATQLTNSCIAHLTKNQPEDYKMEWEDWGNLGKQLDIFLSHVQNYPHHVIVISHETNAKEEQKGKEQLVPVAGTRNFSRNVGRYFDEVIYCQRKNKKHIFASSTTFDTNILTGSRHSVKLEESKRNVKIDDFEIPSLIQIFEAVKPKSASNEDQQAKGLLTGIKSSLENK